MLLNARNLILLIFFALMAAGAGCQRDSGEDGTQATAVQPTADLEATAAPEAVLDIEELTREAASGVEDEPALESTPIAASEIDTSTEEIIVPTETPAPPTDPPPTSTPTPSLVESIRLVPIDAAFVKPTDLTHANDERIFVVEETGAIWIVEDQQKSPEPFLDITNIVGSVQYEQGLLSLVFQPDFPAVNNFYVYYTDLNGDVVISRFSVDLEQPDKALSGSEEILLRIEQPFANHNGGQLRFGPDKMLYISVGDGGSAGDPFNNGQNPSTILGTILRIDVSTDQGYRIPEDNPFIGDSSIPDEIWAYGLRNPWRISFDSETGGLYIADVGQSRWEEVNYQEAGSGGGSNYGWNVTEGSHCYGSDTCDSSGFIEPVAEYSHTEGGCSITGGYVYRGSLYSEMRGNYFFGDYCSGFIWGLVQDSSGQWTKRLLLQGGFNLSSFGEDVHGELYALNHTGGLVYQLQPSSSSSE